MSRPPSPPIGDDDTRAVADAYAALNAGDVEGFVRAFDADVVRVEAAAGAAGERRLRGIAAMRAHVAEGRGTWAEGACEPVRFVARAHRVVALCRVRVRLVGRDDWLEGDTGDVFTFRAGRVIEFRTFWSHAEALAYAGVG